MHGNHTPNCKDYKCCRYETMQGEAQYEKGKGADRVGGYQVAGQVDE